MNCDTIANWIKAICAIGVLIVAIMAYFTDRLPTTERIRGVVKTENSQLLQKNELCVKKCIQEGTQEVIVKLTLFREQPLAARSSIYRNAIEQTKEKGYIYPLTDEGGLNSYITSEGLRSEEWRLLTKSEMEVISEWLASLGEFSEGKDVIDLMDLLLSDKTRIRELLMSVPYDKEVGPERKLYYITPYFKLGIIAGFINEKKAFNTLNVGQS